MSRPFMQDCPIKCTLLQTLLISDINFKSLQFGSVLQEDINFVMYIWVGSTPNQAVTTPQSNVSVPNLHVRW